MFRQINILVIAFSIIIQFAAHDLLPHSHLDDLFHMVFEHQQHSDDHEPCTHDESDHNDGNCCFWHSHFIIPVSGQALNTNRIASYDREFDYCLNTESILSVNQEYTCKEFNKGSPDGYELLTYDSNPRRGPPVTSS